MQTPNENAPSRICLSFHFSAGIKPDTGCPCWDNSAAPLKEGCGHSFEWKLLGFIYPHSLSGLWNSPGLLLNWFQITDDLISEGDFKARQSRCRGTVNLPTSCGLWDEDATEGSGADPGWSSGLRPSVSIRSKDSTRTLSAFCPSPSRTYL